MDFAAPAPAYLENNLGQSNVRRYLLEPGPKDGSHSRCKIVRKKDAFGCARTCCTRIVLLILILLLRRRRCAKGRTFSMRIETRKEWSTLQKSIRSASAVRGEEEEEIEKVSVFALRVRGRSPKGFGFVHPLLCYTFFFLTIVFFSLILNRSRMVVSLDVADIRESSSQYLGKIAATNAAERDLSCSTTARNRALGRRSRDP